MIRRINICRSQTSSPIYVWIVFSRSLPITLIHTEAALAHRYLNFACQGYTRPIFYPNYSPHNKSSSPSFFPQRAKSQSQLHAHDFIRLLCAHRAKKAKPNKSNRKRGRERERKKGEEGTAVKRVEAHKNLNDPPPPPRIYARGCKSAFI